MHLCERSVLLVLTEWSARARANISIVGDHSSNTTSPVDFSARSRKYRHCTLSSSEHSIVQKITGDTQAQHQPAGVAEHKIREGNSKSVLLLELLGYT